jgi:hypothetical protein
MGDSGLNRLSWVIPLVLSLLFTVAACSKQLEYESVEYALLKYRRAVDPDKVILFIGQDLTSIADYAASGYFPASSGVITYLAFYQLSRSSFPAYGALGQDMDGARLIVMSTGVQGH